MEDLTDRRFGKLTAIKIVGKKHGQALWLCRCDCNNYTEVTESHLKTLHTKSCGCLKNKYNTKNKRLLSVWFNMKGRCDKPNRRDSKYYHDKGVTYCDSWKEYKNFEKWSLENGYADNLTLDRIDDSGNYEPSNCQWITLAEQQRKKEGNIWIEHNGERKGKRI